MAKQAKRVRRIPRKPRNTVVTIREVPWDMGATGPANQHRLEDQDRGVQNLETGHVVNPNGVRGKVRLPWYMRYHRKGILSRDHATAAHRLYAAYAGHPTRDPLAAMQDRVDGGGDSDPNVTAVDKRRAFRALWAMVPLSSRPVIEHVILNDRPIRAMAGASNPERAAMHLGRLARGLEALR